MDKPTLNKEIVLMRPLIRRAKVHIIHVLSRKSKQWKNKKTSDTIEIVKNEKKATKLVQEIVALKKLNQDEISKYCLSNTDSPQKMLSSAKAIDRVLARILNLPFVVKHVEAFYKKYPDWKESQISAFKKNENKNKKGTKKKEASSKVVNIKHNNVVDKSHPDIGQKNSVKSTVNKKSKNDSLSDSDQEMFQKDDSLPDSDQEMIRKDDSLFDSDQEMIGNDDSLSDSDQDMIQKDNSLSDSDQETITKCKMKSANAKKNKPPSSLDKKKEKLINSKIKNFQANNDSSETKMLQKRLAEVKRFTEILKSNNSADENENVYEKNDHFDGDNSNEAIVACDVDPFFMNEDGETHYLTSVKVNTDTNEERYTERDEDFQYQSHRGKGYQNSFISGNRREYKVPDPKSMINRSFEKGFHHQERGVHNKDQRFRNSNFKNFQHKDSIESKNKYNKGQNHERNRTSTEGSGALHPSWEAKKRLGEQQFALSAFQGKKIKFDD